jgi:hypothetical protein
MSVGHRSCELLSRLSRREGPSSVSMGDCTERLRCSVGGPVITGAFHFSDDLDSILGILGALEGLTPHSPHVFERLESTLSSEARRP